MKTLQIDEKSDEEAWKALQEADKEKDLDEIKKVLPSLPYPLAGSTLTSLQAVFAYAKAFPSLNLAELETTFRDSGMNTYLIAKEQEISDTHTIVNLQGVKDQKFVISYQFSNKPKRAKFAEGWPTSKEENLTRLAEAGFVMDGLVIKCTK